VVHSAQTLPADKRRSQMWISIFAVTITVAIALSAIAFGMQATKSVGVVD
jgi:hypothetical protein